MGTRNPTDLAAVHEMGTAGWRCPAKILRHQDTETAASPSKDRKERFYLIFKKPWLFKLAEKS